MQDYTGELAALLTAALWTITALAFEQASKRVGSLTVNLIRLFLAFIFYCILSLVRGNPVLPLSADTYSWVWLSVSALIGFVIGDFCLFKSYELIGSRIASLLMALAPPMAAIFAWFVLSEGFSLMNTVGMTLTILGIGLVIMDRPGGKVKLKFKISGVLYGLGGAAGQAIGLVFSKLGMKDLDPFTASHIRVIAGFLSFLILFAIFNKWKNLKPLFKGFKNIGYITIGSFFGPFLGVSFSLMAVKHTTAGIASTIMAIVPVLIIPPTILLYKERITWREIIGAFVAVGGVAVFFIT